MPIRVHRFSRRGLLKWIAGSAAIGALSFLYYRYRLPIRHLGPPTIIPRSEWGAEQPDPNLQNEDGPEVFNTVVVHHSAMPLSESPCDIQYMHMHRADKGIESWLAAAGIGYRSLVELGNVFLDFPDWQPRYQQLLVAAGGLLTERLHGIPGPICLLCAEKHVADCHRLQIAEYLAIHSGVTVHHLE